MESTKENYCDTIRFFFPPFVLPTNVEITAYAQDGYTAYAPNELYLELPISDQIKVQDLAVFNDGHISFTLNQKSIALVLCPNAQVYIQVTDISTDDLILAKKIKHTILLDLLRSFQIGGQA